MGAPEKTCPNCKRVYVPALAARPTRAYAEWRQGKLVQDAFPKSRSFEREQLVSGLCSDGCWAEYLGVEQHEDEGCQFDGGDE